MPFEELNHSRMSDPEARKAEDIKKSDRKYQERVKSTSVSLGSVKFLRFFVRGVLAVLGLLLVFSLGYYMFSLYAA